LKGKPLYFFLFDLSGGDSDFFERVILNWSCFKVFGSDLRLPSFCALDITSCI